MADQLIEDEIHCALLEGPVRVPTHGQFRYKAGIGGSSMAVKRALGSMISRGLVLRHRPLPQSCTSGEEPITIRLAH